MRAAVGTVKVGGAFAGKFEVLALIFTNRDMCCSGNYSIHQ